MEVEGIVKGRLCFTIMDREGLRIARLGSADLNFAQLWIKVCPPTAAHQDPASTLGAQELDKELSDNSFFCCVRETFPT